MSGWGSLLALYTTEPRGSIAVAAGGRRGWNDFETDGQHAPVLVASVLRLLGATGVGWADLEAVAVTSGPGSFTGIRVGLATAQGLAAARNWKVLVCDSLKARAAAWTGLGAPLAVVLDARRGEVYGALYDVTGPLPVPLLDPFCAAPAGAAARLWRAVPVAASRLALTGSGATLVAGELSGIPVEMLGEPGVPVAAALLELAVSGGCEPLEPQAVEPIYLRKSDAEVRRDSFLGPAA